MRYLDWNDRIAEKIFRPEMAHRRVYLFVSREFIDEIAAACGEPPDNFIEQVKVGPDWVYAPGLCQRALQTAALWRDKSLPYPPYIGYLALFVIAAGIEGDFESHAYYPRLRTLLKEEPTTGQLPSFGRMLELWDDLETWAKDDKNGELGIFETFILGSLMHVGLPLSQTLLTEHERYFLPSIFGQAGLDPTTQVSEDELIKLVAASARSEFRPRTLSMLAKPEKLNPELKSLIGQIFLEELEEWERLTKN